MKYSLLILLALQSFDSRLAPLAQDGDPKQVDEWVRQLKHEDIAVRDEAAKKLVALGEKVLPLLEKYEKSDDTELRGRVAEVRKRIQPPPPAWEEIFAVAEAAIKGESKVEKWRPRLGELLDAYLELLGADANPKSMERAREARARCFDETFGVLTENVDKVREAALVVKAAKGTEIDRQAIVLCESAEYDNVEDSLVVCLGDVKVRDMKRSVVFARGRVAIGKKARDCVVHCTGAFTSADEAENLTVLSLAGVDVVDTSEDCVYVNVRHRKAGKERGENREVANAKLPSVLQVEDVFALAEKDDRAALRRFIERYIELHGRDVAREAPKVAKILDGAFGKGPGQLKIGKGNLDLQDLPDESVLIHTGYVKARKLEYAIVFVRGTIEVAKEIDHCIVFCEGALRVLGDADHNTVIAFGGVEITGRADENVWVNSAVKGAGRDDRSVTISKLPSKRK